MNPEPNVKKISEKKIARTKRFIAVFLSISGVLLILTQSVPLFRSFVNGKIEMLKESLMKDPLPESYKQYISDEFAYYDPGKSYFANLSSNAGQLQYSGVFSYDPSTKSTKEIVVDKLYNENMSITIQSIGIEDIRITPNVESSDEAVYDKFLKYGLAHFKGTPLPGDGGNSFIYGHSAVISFFNKHSNLPETIFTKLENIEVGDSVKIKKDGKYIEYVVRNKRIVSPDDFSILRNQGDKETVTLMTCWPLGVGTKRLIAVAEKL
jgi:LPXTG-site transpeptidase (sortase) family protein